MPVSLGGISRAKKIQELQSWVRQSVIDNLVITLLAGNFEQVCNWRKSSVWPDADTLLLVIEAIDIVYGSPMALTQEQSQLRQYSYLFHNPTQRNVNVEPMGLPDEEGNLIKLVVPGGLIRVPWAYTQGKSSTVKACAPQLKQLEASPQNDTLLDLPPRSYYEWLMYAPYKPSKCCKKQVLWSDKQQCLLCQACKHQLEVM